MSIDGGRVASFTMAIVLVHLSLSGLAFLALVVGLWRWALS